MAEAREVDLNPKLASYTVNVTDEAGSLIAIFQGLVYRKNQPIAAAVP
jgi:acyl-CoA thioesterase